VAGTRARVTAPGPLGYWFGSRVAVAVAAAAATGSIAGAWLRGWYHWDVALYIKVAQYGYGGYPEHYSDPGIAAFFPGLPLVLRAVHAVVPTWIGAGLLISLVAGTVAAVALARLTELDARRPAGAFAVLALVLSPYAVFLAAGYSESLFLAFALPAWLMARRRAWVEAGVLAAAASTVRVTGLFLAVALLVEYAVVERRLRPNVVALFAPVIPVGLFVYHLHHVLGDWLAWPHAESHVWGRHLTAPWTALHTTWVAASSNWHATYPHHTSYAVQFGADIAAVALGVVLTAYLIWRRRFGEMTYVGLQVAALATSSYYLSVGRATLLWWPLWVLLGRTFTRHSAALWAYVVVAAPLMVAACVGFTGASWWVG
jgi:hypothetical protein